ncbi:MULTISPECIES: hypothetical protein [Acinetobacter]|uniref:hypothetical protein n=1 Tax=Acinetobacter TaxID=469 RepID=UPI000742FC7D|nr:MULTISPECIES: hypothetical protein [Acinetobacter]ALY01449.1 hypothetical protein KBNAB1_3944 [Acinetobacter baumannii]EKT9248047.1 hypothetical protein [Acinetobacter baumannii]EKV8039642.1 hypothetical protein [Acinetobacter baumannii]MBE2308796.1 hypothetical protein [Acinetobacter baumannii]MBE2623455.1 hypothetical protein [Acinetobacter baumannii]
MSIAFDELERREFDRRFYLLTNIQYAISIYQGVLLEKYIENPKDKIVDDFKSLSQLQANLTQQNTQTLRNIYHDISIKMGGLLDAR